MTVGKPWRKLFHTTTTEKACWGEVQKQQQKPTGARKVIVWLKLMSRCRIALKNPWDEQNGDENWHFGHAIELHAVRVSVSIRDLYPYF